MLRLSGAGRAFGRRTIFADIHLDVPPGMRLLLAGTNGSGKTTLLRCMAGSLALTSGRGSVWGAPMGTPAARERVGACLTSERGLYDELTARQNLVLFARLRLPWRRVAGAVAQVEEELDLGSFARTPLRRCSTGMRALVGFGLALFGEPPLLLLDEPSRSLDRRGHELLWAALGRRPATACVLSSHQESDRARCHETLTMPGRR
jgi:ABC-type multidrug transport system ATPase subunit